MGKSMKSFLRGQANFLRYYLGLGLLVIIIACSSGGGESGVTSTSIAVDKASLDFATTFVGVGSTTQSIAITNTGQGPLLISGLSGSGTNGSEFVFALETCRGQIAAGASCDVSVQFRPADGGARAGSLIISYNGSVPQSVSLTGTGLLPPVATLTGSLDFADMDVGVTSAVRKITLTNTGKSPLAISAITLTGAQAANFTLDPNNICVARLGPGASCELEFRFKPSAVGALTASLDIKSNAPVASVSALKGTGRTPAVTFPEQSYRFASQDVNTASAEKALILVNSGSANYSVTSVSMVGGEANDFTVTNACPAAVSVGASCNVIITFKPTATGLRQTTLTIADNTGVGPRTVEILGSGQNPVGAVTVVQTENAKTAADGVSTAWLIADANYAGSHEIEGYASATSVNRGEQINLFVNTSSLTYTMSIYRVGWYGGAGGRLVAGPFAKTGNAQAACPVIDAAANLAECNWTISHTLGAADTTNLTSGVYLAKLTASGGKQNYIIFVVRDDARPSDFLFQSAVTTYAAYNAFGGADFYPGHAKDSVVPVTPTGIQAYKVSLNRPYAKDPVTINKARGVGDFFEWEIHMVRFLEQMGYDVTYSTNVDTHRNPAALLKHRTFLSVGHDEYYTREMYNAVQTARNKGVNLAFFGANNIYWQMRFEPDSVGKPDRTIVSYKSKFTLDPAYEVNTATATSTWRAVGSIAAPLSNRDETGLMGVGFVYNSIDSDMVIANCTSVICTNIFAGTNLKAGDKLLGMLGYEIDRVSAMSPANVQVLTESPYVCPSTFTGCTNNTLYSNMAYYQAASGSGVFSTGSMNWNWGLSSFGPADTTARSNPSVQKMTDNLLKMFARQ